MRNRDASVDVALPITPMLDMSFQLLAFFVLTFHPLPTEGQLAANMPAAPANVDPQEPPAEAAAQDEYTIAVYSADGAIAGMSLRGPTVVRGDIRTLGELRDAVETLPKTTKGGNPGVTMTIAASNDLAYARLIEVIDLCKKAGIESINLTPLRRGPMS